MKTLAILILLTHAAMCQNLIPNPGFEENDFGQVRVWKQPIEDYYHYETQFVRNDSQNFYNYVNGLCLLQPDPSEFLLAKLKKPLEANKQYCFKLSVLKGPAFVGKQHYIKSIEIAFSDTNMEVSKRKTLYLPPAISMPLFDAENKLIQPDEVIYTAQGFEKYIIIGKFHSLDNSYLESSMTLEKRREKIWREQYYAADSIKKYFVTLLPKLEPVTSKKEAKRAAKALKDSLEKLEMARLEAIQANAQFYQKKIANLETILDSSVYHVRLYFDNICLAPVKPNGTCNCEEKTTQAFTVGQTYRLNNILFDLDKATFKPESYAEMDYLVDVLRQYPKMEIQLNGHTDSLNTAQYNIELSNKRAKAVYDYLAQKGVKVTRLKWKGYGEAKPLTDNGTEEGRAINRRVEFVVLKVE